jgi:hypothetical protein
MAMVGHWWMEKTSAECLTPREVVVVSSVPFKVSIGFAVPEEVAEVAAENTSVDNRPK